MTTDAQKYANDYKAAGLPVPPALQKQIAAESKPAPSSGGGFWYGGEYIDSSGRGHDTGPKPVTPTPAPVVKPPAPSSGGGGNGNSGGGGIPAYTGKYYDAAGTAHDTADQALAANEAAKNKQTQSVNTTISQILEANPDMSMDDARAIAERSDVRETLASLPPVNANNPISENGTGMNSKTSPVVDNSQEQKAAIKELQTSGIYKAGQINPLTGDKRGENYDLVGFIYDGGNIDTIQKSGLFTDATIKKVEEATARQESYESFVDRYSQKKYGKSYEEINRDQQSPKESNKDFIKRSYENNIIRGEADKAYILKYGDSAFAATLSSKAGEFLVGPAMRAIRPEVTIKDISGEEWVWTGVGVASYFAPVVAGKILSTATVKSSNLGRLALKAGQANGEMETAISRLNKTSMGATNYVKTSATTQSAIQSSKMADTKFIQAFQSSQPSINQIKKLEKMSGVKGLAKSADNVATTQRDLNTAWAKLEKTKVGSPGYPKALNNLETARYKYTNSVNQYEAKLTARGPSSKPAGYSQPIQKAESKINELENIAKDLEGRIKNANLNSSKKGYHAEWLEVKAELDNKKIELEALITARNKGIPGPEIKRYLVRNLPSKDLFNEIASWKGSRSAGGKQPLKDLSKMPEYKPGEPQPQLETAKTKTKTQVITKERPSQQQLLDPEFEKPVVEPKTKTSFNPKQGKGVIPGYSPLGKSKTVKTTKTETPEEHRERVYSKPSERQGTQLNDAVSNRSLPNANSSVKEWSKPDESTQTKPATESKTITDTDTATKTGTGPNAGTNPNSGVAIVPGVDNKTAPSPQPGIKTATTTTTRTGTTVDNQTKPSYRIRIKPGKSVQKAEKEGEPQVKPGSLVWEMGKIEVDSSSPGPETVYKYAEPGKYEVKTSVGKAPEGYKDTGDTPATTIQTINGRVGKPVSVKIGITTAHALPDRQEITFTSNHTPSISKRAGRITSRGVGITPRRPRISR